MSVYRSEQHLLAGLEDFATSTIDGDRHYLTAYNGERWRSGFDLPFLRQACVRRDLARKVRAVRDAEASKLTSLGDL